MAKKTSYGLGFSPLSIKNKAYASPEEMVAQKDIGLFGIADENKNIVSHEYMARSKFHLDKFVTRLMQDNTLGKLYKITINDQLATVITNGTTNLIEGANIKVNNGETRIYGVRFNFDLDVFRPSTSAVINFNDITATIKMRYQIGDSTPLYQNIENVKLSEINTTAYVIDSANNLANYTGDVVISLDSIVINPGADFDYNTYKVALYDVLFVVIDV